MSVHVHNVGHRCYSLKRLLRPRFVKVVQVVIMTFPYVE